MGVDVLKRLKLAASCDVYPTTTIRILHGVASMRLNQVLIYTQQRAAKSDGEISGTRGSDAIASFYYKSAGWQACAALLRIPVTNPDDAWVFASSSSPSSVHPSSNQAHCRHPRTH